MKRIRDVIRGCTEPGCEHLLTDLYRQRKAFPRMYGKVLLACVGQQTNLLTELWAHVLPPTPEVRTFWLRVVNAGKFPDYLDPLLADKVRRVFRDVSKINN